MPYMADCFEQQGSKIWYVSMVNRRIGSAVFADPVREFKELTHSPPYPLGLSKNPFFDLPTGEEAPEDSGVGGLIN